MGKPKMENNTLEISWKRSASKFNEARNLWHSYMDKYILEYGMPTLYLGCVNYMHDKFYDAQEVLDRINLLPLEERSKVLKTEKKYLKKWIMPGKYAVALFTNAASIVILGEIFKMREVKSFERLETNESFVYNIKIKRKGERFVSIPVIDKRSDIELRATLRGCLLYTESGTKYNDIGEIKPIKDNDLDKSLLSFEGVSLGFPIKEFIYALKNIEDEKIDVSIIQLNPDYLLVNSRINEFPINWHFKTRSHKYVYESYEGVSDPMNGYDKVREAYKACLLQMSQRFGKPREIYDVPLETPRNHVFKRLRDGVYKIESCFELGYIKASVQIQANEKEKRTAHVRIFATDTRLNHINSNIFKRDVRVFKKDISTNDKQEIKEIKKKDFITERQILFISIGVFLLFLLILAIPVWFIVDSFSGESFSVIGFIVLYVFVVGLILAIISSFGEKPVGMSGKRGRTNSFFRRGRYIPFHSLGIRGYHPQDWRKGRDGDLFYKKPRRSRW